MSTKCEAYEIGIKHRQLGTDDCPFKPENGMSVERIAYWDGWYDEKHRAALGDWEMKTQKYWESST